MPVHLWNAVLGLSMNSELSLVVLARSVERASAVLEQAMRERDDAIRAAHAEGLSLRAIADEAGVSFQRVAAIVNEGKGER